VRQERVAHKEKAQHAPHTSDANATMTQDGTTVKRTAKRDGTETAVGRIVMDKEAARALKHVRLRTHRLRRREEKQRTLLLFTQQIQVKMRPASTPRLFTL